MTTVPDPSDHAHCKVCGRVCAVGEETCNRSCREQRTEQIARRRRLTYLLYGMMALLFIVALSSYLR